MKKWLGPYAGVLLGIFACAGVAYWYYVQHFGETTEG